jgi:GH25 family lysozyme M1 (1,4-beta-N-acetylmuramidase)
MKKKIILLLILVIIIVGIVITLLLFREKEETYDYEITEEEIVLIKDKIEVYDEVNLKDVIELNNKYELINDYKIDSEKLGTVRLDIDYRDLEKEKDKKGHLEISIVDTTPPYVDVGDHYSHLVNTNFTFYDDVICKDNYDRQTKCEIVGDYDISTIGESNVKIVSTDSSGNKTEHEFVLRVIEKSPVKSEIIKIEELTIPENASLMIDVSKWQKDIDWKKVKEAGIDYVMMRLGTQKAVDKENVLDTYFEQNIKGAQENGIEVGVYFFSYANDIDDVREQANWVVEQLKDYKIDIGVAFDWESFNLLNEMDINLHEFKQLSNEFLKIIEENGYKPINYGSKSKLESLFDTSKYYTWLAHYTDNTTYEGNYLIWQFSDMGIVPGITGKVDLDYYYNK